MRYRAPEWRPMAGAGTYTGGPKRLVLHTTEGWSLESAESAYQAKTIAPHFTACFVTRRWAQHIDTASSASAMANLSGGVQTNRDGAVQIEIVGFAAYTQDMNDDDLRWLGGIVREVCEREGIDVNRFKTFVGTEAGTIATTTAKQRMPFAEWESFNGVCGHQHVPENHHWDPGRFPYQRMLDLTNTGDEDVPMPLIVKGRNTPEWWITDGIRKDHLEDVGIAGGLVYVGLAKWDNATNGPFPVDDSWINSIPTGLMTPPPTAAEIARAVVAALPPVAGGTADTLAIIDAIPAQVKRAMREGTG